MALGVGRVGAEEMSGRMETAVSAVADAERFGNRQYYAQYADCGNVLGCLGQCVGEPLDQESTWQTQEVRHCCGCSSVHTTTESICIDSARRGTRCRQLEIPYDQT